MGWLVRRFLRWVERLLWRRSMAEADRLRGEFKARLADYERRAGFEHRPGSE